MNQQQKLPTDKRVIPAPPPTDPSIPPSIYYIEVKPDWDVEWQWTVFPDGNRVVTGYKLIEKELTRTKQMVELA